MDTYLKTLSQKKYAWMEEATAASNAPAASVPATTSQQPSGSIHTTTSSSDTSNKAIERPTDNAADESTSNKSKKRARSKEPSDQLTSGAAADPEADGTNVSQPLFRYTTFPIKGYTILPVRNIASNFMRSEITQVRGCAAGDNALCPNPDEEWQDTIIIHPGSRHLRIGLSSEAYPVTVPHVLARRVRAGAKTASRSDDMDLDSETKALALKEMRNELAWRMKNAKRRTVPNADAQVTSFNSTVPKETIPDHNDPYRVEWIHKAEQERDVYVGDMAFRLPLDGKNDAYRLFYPWKHGSLNRQDYTSIQAILGDLETIWTDAIHTSLGIEDKSMERYNCVLVIPDIIEPDFITHLVDMLLKEMKFKAVIVQEAAACATYGAGTSSACVVDIGAQTTSIVCVDEGVPFVQSKKLIHVGGDDITRVFASFLRENQFPYRDMDLARFYDWSLAEDLKERWCTMNESEISIQVYDFFVRAPEQHTLKYQCKVYDEAFLSPLCLVYPTILDPMPEPENAYIATGIMDEAPDDNVVNDTDGNVKQNVYGHYPIDIAIAQSIQAAANLSEERLKRLFTNVIIVGGGGKISNFDRVLEDRLLSTVIASTNKIENVEVLPAPRELDPQILVWKGASVLCKLDVAREMWIGPVEWNEVGERLLRDRSMLL
ncbi:hypothetical protein BC940DRAFT_297583 [Gongronella butleri]|nr:hypothetical protein BC940DRAFT_297583 [Gongronella butleri]